MIYRRLSSPLCNNLSFWERHLLAQYQSSYFVGLSRVQIFHLAQVPSLCSMHFALLYTFAVSPDACEMSKNMIYIVRLLNLSFWGRFLGQESTDFIVFLYSIFIFFVKIKEQYLYFLVSKNKGDRIDKQMKKQIKRGVIVVSSTNNFFTLKLRGENLTNK